VVPHLVAVAVTQFLTLGRTVSAPRLNPSRKQRSSRQYLPSSPELFEDDEILVDQLGADGGHDGEVDSDEVDKLAVLHVIGHAQQGVWSERRTAVESEGEESEGDDDEDENREDSKEEDHEYWEEYNDLEGSTGLSALD